MKEKGKVPHRDGDKPGVKNKSIIRSWEWICRSHVANAGKVLQSFIYKSVNTGQLFNWLVAKRIVKFFMFMLKEQKYFELKSENKH